MLLMCMCIVLCLVNRSNVIFALTHHGGHLGYFEGGIVLPNSVTWLDRIVVEFSTALLHCKTTDLQQPEMCTSVSNSCADNDWLSKRLISASDTGDEDDNDDDDDIVVLQRQQEQASTSPAGTENKFAAEMVAEILRVSASMVCNDTGSVLPRASKELVDDGDVIGNQ